MLCSKKYIFLTLIKPARKIRGASLARSGLRGPGGTVHEAAVADGRGDGTHGTDGLIGMIREEDPMLIKSLSIRIGNVSTPSPQWRGKLSAPSPQLRIRSRSGRHRPPLGAYHHQPLIAFRRQSAIRNRRRSPKPSLRKSIHNLGSG